MTSDTAVDNVGGYRIEANRLLSSFPKNVSRKLPNVPRKVMMFVSIRYIRCLSGSPPGFVVAIMRKLDVIFLPVVWGQS